MKKIYIPLVLLLVFALGWGFYSSFFKKKEEFHRQGASIAKTPDLPNRIPNPNKEEMSIEQMMIYNDHLKQLLEIERTYQQNQANYYDQLYQENITVLKNQHKQSIWLFAIVSVITLSGIILSWYQLKKSFDSNIISDNHLELSSEKIKITSSVVGLLILALSFAFYWLYITEVYTIKLADSHHIEMKK